MSKIRRKGSEGRRVLCNFKHISFFEKDQNVSEVCSLRNAHVMNVSLLDKVLNRIPTTLTDRPLRLDLPREVVVFDVILQANIATRRLPNKCYRTF